MSTDNIYNRNLNNDDGGIVWSFEDATGQEQGEASLTISKSDIQNSEPVILGDVIGMSGTNEIIHDSVTIKKVNSWDVGIPNCLDFTVDVAAFAMNDLLKNAGPEFFHECEIGLIIQRTLVKPEAASRPSFAGWHTHTTGRDPLALTYQFSDALQTELKKSGSEDPISAHNNALIRMGSGIIHRSQTNTSGEEVIRTWGAILVYPQATKPRNGAPYNMAFSANLDTEFPPFSDIKTGNSFKPLAQPIPLF